MADRNQLPVIALTQGDPAGIGPELCLKVVRDPRVLSVCRPIIIGDRSVLEQVGAKLGLVMPEKTLSPAQFENINAPDCNANDNSILIDCAIIDADVMPGVATREAGAASCRYIELAAQYALSGAVAGICTAPITKTTLKMAGIDEPGHTEILGRLTGCGNFAMMLYSERLAVSLVTIHQSLASVPAALKIEEIRRVTTLTGETLKKIRGKDPRLVVLGLNPHAGEGGMFGREEIELIAPAIELSRKDGWNIEGPMPPDAAFMPHNAERFDGHVCMYHDQGLIPFKMVSMHDGVNITMGLPIVRTSVDHGTAYNIAWQGRAEMTSFIAAIELAARLAKR